MRINQTYGPTAGKVRRGRQSDTAGGGFADHLTLGASAQTEGATPTAPLASLASLLTAQDIGERDAQQQGVERGFSMLDRLDELRMGLLEGRADRALLRRIDGLVRQQVESHPDPQARAVLREIEVRAAVELAKLERL